MLKNKIIGIILFVSVSILFYAEESQAKTSKTLDIDIRKEALPVKSLNEISNQVNNTIKGFQAEIEYDNEILTFGYELGIGESLEEALQNFNQEYKEYMVKEGINLNSLYLSVINLEHDSDTIKKFEKSDIGFEIIEANDVSLASIPPTIDNDRPLPYKGHYAIMEGSGENFIYQDFVFSKWEIDGFKGDGIRSSFELDTVFYNYDGKAYSVNYGGKTQGTWWMTNLPSPYLDTQFGDDWAVYGGSKNSYGEPSEVNFAVGTSDADNLEPGLTYYYRIDLKKNTRSNLSYKIKLNAQPGYNLGFGAWGTFSYYTTRIVPFKTFTVNTMYTWTRP